MQEAARGAVDTGPAWDHPVKVDVAGLNPGTDYWYRFRALEAAPAMRHQLTNPCRYDDHPRILERAMNESATSADSPRIGRRRVLMGAAGVAAAMATGGMVGTPRAKADVLPLPLPGSGSCGEVAKLPMPTTRSLNVLLTGDAGTGDAQQRAVAQAARAVGEREGLSLAIGLGDNIYEFGADGTCDEDFHTKFEQPNEGIDVPWLMVQGNHDNTLLFPGDGGVLVRGDYEVAYHRHSARWYMPDRYYSVALPVGAERPVVEFFVLDDNPVTSSMFQLDPYYTNDGPFMRAQRAWLRRGLAESTATWKFVLAHHPYRNNGPHGEAGSYDGISFLDDLGGGLLDPLDYHSGKHFRTLIEEDVLGHADWLLAGHDHSQQLLDIAATANGTQQIVCGASAKVGAPTPVSGPPQDRNTAFWQDYSKPGFMMLKIRDAKLIIDAYTVETATGAATLAYRHTQPR